MLQLKYELDKRHMKQVSLAQATKAVIDNTSTP